MVGVQLGNGDGTFQAVLPLPSGTLGASVVGDFNGDGKLDVAGFTSATHVNPGQIQVLFGSGMGPSMQRRSTLWGLESYPEI